METTAKYTRIFRTAMNLDAFWHCIKAVAATFGPARNWSDEPLDQLQVELMRMGMNQRNDLREDCRSIISGLERLEARLGAECFQDPA
jgi:hypothetical protein